MGLCHGKPIETQQHESNNHTVSFETDSQPPNSHTSKASNPFYSPSPLPSLFKYSPAISSVSSTPLRIFKRPFPPPSPAKHIRALLARRHGSVKPNEAPIPEGRVRSLWTRILGSPSSLRAIMSLGGKYSEDDAKTVMVQILSVVAYCHLQGVVHRDLKPENFLFTTKESSPLKAIDFGLSDYVKPDERLNDIVGSAYYVAPEVLHRSYGTEADMWSIGVIAYILLCGSRPFWARTESGIFRAVLKADPIFDDAPWTSLSPEAIDFVKRLLNKDYRKRLTAAQALSHPWLANHHDIKIPLDMIVYKLVKTYIYSSSLRKSALGALAKTLTIAQLAYLREQFTLLGPSKNGFISMSNFKMALVKNSTDAVKNSRVLDYVSMVSSLQYRKLDFEEFCAAAISVHQLEGMDCWEQHARRAYELFEKDGNRPIMIEELASELGLSHQYQFMWFSKTG
ncbi:hypothetical protein GH714_007675 [Hevea brasiliensis]|uniref:Protein kinase domain-containing protein n=1 Tax=Hevea brasiliensis TaxID=3981 RepID=A0A6A6KK74_HEVBR|nr:hypothetical protein GH714_007675 [Hevea brasiliensis]